MTIMIPAWVNGELTPVEKLDAHKKGIKHKAVSVFVMRGGEVLIQRRALGKYHTPGLWANTCCTHPDWREDARDCAIRRLDEELGITGLAPDFRQRVEYRADVGDDLIEHEVVDIFVCSAPDDLEFTPNPSEVMDTRWIGLGALCADVKARPHLYTPWLRIYLDAHLNEILGSS